MRKHLLLLAALLAVVGSAKAGNFLTVENAEIPQGSEGDVVVSLTNDVEFVGFQFSITLPEGLELTSFEQSNRLSAEYNVSYSTHGATSIFTGFSFPLTAISGQQGALLTLHVKSDAALAVGTELQATIDEIEFGTAAEVPYNPEAVTFGITIGQPLDTHIVLDEYATDVPVAAEEADVRVLRTIAPDTWETLVLPFDVSSKQLKEIFGPDVRVAEFSSWESDEDAAGQITDIRLNFVSANSISANVPCLVNAQREITEFTLEGISLQPSADPTVQVGKTRAQRGFMIGTYVAQTLVPEDNLYLENEKFQYSDGFAEMLGYRAYFELFDVLDNTDEAPGRVRILVDDVTVGVASVVMGQGGKYVYDLQGRRISKNDVKGLYIEDGRKAIKR